MFNKLNLSFLLVILLTIFLMCSCASQNSPKPDNPEMSGVKVKAPQPPKKPIVDPAKFIAYENSSNAVGPKDSSKADQPKDSSNAVQPKNSVSPNSQIKDEPIDSGPAAWVPWEDSKAFKEAQVQNKTKVLLAAYRTVLRDPLPGEEENVHLAARLLAGTVLESGQVFSQNGRLGPYTKSRGYKKGPTYVGSQLTTTIGGGVCKIASTLYNVTVLSNLQVVERECHAMPVPYVPYGQDATVSYGSQDYRFRNNTSSPVLIWAQGVDNILYIGFYGSKPAPKVVWHHEMTSVKKAKTLYHKNSKLAPDEKKLIHNGMNGAVVKSWVTITGPDGRTTTKKLGTSYYSPMPYIYEKGS